MQVLTGWLPLIGPETEPPQALVIIDAANPMLAMLAYASALRFFDAIFFPLVTGIRLLRQAPMPGRRTNLVGNPNSIQGVAVYPKCRNPAPRPGLTPFSPGRSERAGAGLPAVCKPHGRGPSSARR